jgi:hypothetical protein
MNSQVNQGFMPERGNYMHSQSSSKANLAGLQRAQQIDSLAKLKQQRQLGNIMKQQNSNVNRGMRAVMR